MFGVASTFRKTHGEAAFNMLAKTIFTETDVDHSGKIDTSELQTALSKLGMKLSDPQTADVLRRQYRAPWNIAAPSLGPP